MKRMMMFVIGFCLTLVSCDKKDVFRPHDFVGKPTGEETLRLHNSSLPTYPTNLEFELVDYTINNQTKDTLIATYKVKGLLAQTLDAWGETMEKGGEILITLDNTDFITPKVLIGNALKYPYDDNPLPDYTFYGETSNSSGKNVFDFYKTNEGAENRFSIKDKTIVMHLDHIDWIRETDYFGDKGVLYVNLKFE
ncbi:hypothetical protein [Aureivirga marina]|uniref:hypothetical protein n=1 Tax=Aureivirga marina TaxID=1182451 RepID=UPI0018CA3B8C|nr:hypothetical protein [Aureivirga marina]